jgi:trimeric autotransporter adhesin
MTHENPTGRIHSRLTFANVVSVIALFVALGGTAAAATIITSNSQVAQDTISGHNPPAGAHSNIITGSVTSADLASGAVGNKKLANGAVGTAKLADKGVTGAKIADHSLTGAEIRDKSLTEDDIADLVSSGGVTRVELGAETTLLQDGPFTVTVTCVGFPPDQTLDASYVTITSSEEHSVADMTNWGNGEIPPGGMAVAATRGYDHWSGSPFFAAAPSGATLEGHIGAGIETLGYTDCTATVTAIGTSALH